MAVVDGLDEAARGDVVFGDGDLHQAVVGDGAGRLHEPFAEGAFAHDDASVEVLNGPGDDFRRRCRGAVDEYGQRCLGVDRLVGCLVDFLVDKPFAPGADHFGAFGDEEAHNLHGALQQSAAVVAQVKDD